MSISHPYVRVTCEACGVEEVREIEFGTHGWLFSRCLMDDGWHIDGLNTWCADCCALPDTREIDIPGATARNGG